MGDLAADTRRWVKAGHITDAQRSAILASDKGSKAPTPEPSMQFPRTGPHAEGFVAGMGALTALLAGLITISAGGNHLFFMVVPAGILALSGATLLLGLRGDPVIADIAFAGALWLCAAAALDLGQQDWRLLAPFVAIGVAAIGILRIVRLAIAGPAVALTFLYVTAALPTAEVAMVVLAFPFVLVVAATALYAFRRPIRAWSNAVWDSRTGDQDPEP